MTDPTDKPKFTPGPWAASYQSRHLWLITGNETHGAGDGQYNTHVALTCHWTDDDPLEESSANAHLIAAAPALYDILSQMLDVADDGREPSAPLMLEASRVLAAARGEG